MTTAKFIFENIATGFGYPKVLMSDQGTHFLNRTIEELIEEFQIYHQNSTPDHPQANEIVQQFNKILEHALIKVCNVKIDD